MQDSKEQLDKAKTKLKVLSTILYITFGLVFILFWGLFIIAGVAFGEGIIFGLLVVASMVLLVILASKATGKLEHQIKVQEANVSRLNSRVFFEKLDKEGIDKSIR